MDLIDKIGALAQRIAKQRDVIETEEATKTAFVMPFLSLLGYDVFDPLVVVPEFTADVGVKKGEKVDYALKRDGRVIMLIECKPCMAPVSGQHTSQLFRYFSVTDARFAILTNGIVYWFYTDLEQPNKMDDRPFFTFDLLDFRPGQVEELKKFANTNFDEAAIIETASDLKYGSLLMREIAAELDSPSDEFKRMLISRVWGGRMLQSVVTRFDPLVQRAVKDTVRELLNQRLSSALDNGPAAASPVPNAAAEGGETATEPEQLDNGIVTTDEEREAYQIVRAIVRQVVPVDRVGMRDAKSYCAILLDDNNRRPICRLHLNRGTKYIGLFNADREEERVQISGLDEIFAYAERLKETAASYDKAKEEA